MVTAQKRSENPQIVLRLGSLYTILTKDDNYDVTTQRKRDMDF